MLSADTKNYGRNNTVYSFEIVDLLLQCCLRLIVVTLIKLLLDCVTDLFFTQHVTIHTRDNFHLIFQPNRSNKAKSIRSFEETNIEECYNIFQQVYNDTEVSFITYRNLERWTNNNADRYIIL